MALVFVEWSSFSRRRAELLTEEEFRALQNEIIQTPEKGKLIPGSGGLRKIRLGVQGSGKSGGARVIYYYVVIADRIHLLYLYRKNEQEDLTADQMNAIRKAIAGERL